MATNPQTIPEFVRVCEKLNKSEVYNLFEHGIDPALRDAIYLMAPRADMNEPVRAAFIELGKLYSVYVLFNW